MTNHSSARDTQSSGFTVAIVLAGVISGAVLVTTGVLVVMCHVTNRRRRKEQSGRWGMELKSMAEERIESADGSGGKE